MIQIDWKSGVPAYEQIVDSIIKLIAAKAFKEGDKLPSVRSLAYKMGINPNTVQKAYIILEARGITYSVKGKGIFIAENAGAYKQIQADAIQKIKEAITYAELVGVAKNEINASIKSMLEEDEYDISTKPE